MKTCIVVLAVLLALLAPVANAQVHTVVPLPANLSGELNGVPYLIRVPGNWNGTLLVYSYGYAEASTPPPLAPLPAVVESLLAKGYALAVSRAVGTVPMTLLGDAGWNLRERIQSTVALTAAFRDMVGQPLHTIAWGKSLGGLITLGMIEKFPGLFDGALAFCAPAAGAPRRHDQGLDVTLAYVTAFQDWDDSWGTPGDLRDDLDFMIEVLPHVTARLTAADFGKWEFVRRVNRIPIDTFYAGSSRVQVMLFSMGARAELERRAGGPVATNIGRAYTLTADDQAALTALGVNWSSLLAQMNANTNIAAAPNARNYVEHYINPSGRITRPVLTVHTEGDWLATPTHEGAYALTVQQAGKTDFLVQLFVPGGAHCTFTPAQVSAAVDAMSYWLDTNNRPPTSLFPDALGFDPDYVIPGWAW